MANSPQKIIIATATLTAVLIGGLVAGHAAGQSTAYRAATAGPTQTPVIVVHTRTVVRTKTVVVVVTPTAAPTVMPTATAVPTQPPLACPGTLHNADWAVVSLKPSHYVGCTVDVAANMYQTQTMDGYVTYDCQLDPNGNHDWTIFADDYADVPPAINENTYVEIKGTITQAAESVNSVGGAFQGYVPELKVQSITSITAAQAHQLGMALS